MTFNVTKKMLVDWAGQQIVREAEQMVERGQVLEAEYAPPRIHGVVLSNNRELKTSLKLLTDGTVESECPCWANRERGIICAHVVALAWTLVKRAADPDRQAKYEAEQNRASRLAAVDESAYIPRATEDTPGAVAARLLITLDEDWQDGWNREAIGLRPELECRGERFALDTVPRTHPFTFSRHDESLLYVLEDMAQGPPPAHLEVARSDFLNIVALHAGNQLRRANATPITVNEVRLATHLRMDLDAENGELILIAHTELPYLKPGRFPFYLVAGRQGWAYGADNLWPLETVLPAPYHGIYVEPVVVERPGVLRFLDHEIGALSACVRIETDIVRDLFTIEPATPRFRLHVRGSPASLTASLFAQYGPVELTAAKPDAAGGFAQPDPDDLMRYTVRNPPVEDEALARLRALGLVGECGDTLTPIVGKREVLNFLGQSVPALRRLGWRVDMEGRVTDYFDSLDFATPVVHIEEKPGDDTFDVGFDFEHGTEGSRLTHAEIQQAIRMGNAFLSKGDNIVLIDTEAIDAMLGVFSDAATAESEQAGHFRMSTWYAGFVKASLDSLDGVDVEDTPAWRRSAEQANRTARVEPVEIRPPLGDLLRPYQRDGAAWLRFLETGGFGGLLADEMGLGKTIETLAWLQLERHLPDARGKPSLVVCPTSLVDNWAEEAERFTPGKCILTMMGPDRHDRWSQVPEADLVITSYTLIRRDLDRYVQHEFAAIILDEAQHIKNRSTQNAQAAKQLRGHHRVVLTGTPIENSVSDLWSIMDFLMPGYLGTHETFRTHYEKPISGSGPEAVQAQAKLKRKLHPFLLRRRRADVAKDLPPKIQKTSFCLLTPDQRKVYETWLETSRTRLTTMVRKRGFQSCRMEILTTLMRLRQICCHLGLLKLPGLNPDRPSVKTELFFELLDEALDGGHRILVFSQFVSMLRLLRNELDQRKVPFCYLDGSTKNRMDVVREFNTNREIPLFLISLKAGGTGLNLTGADMVIHFDPWWNPAVEDQATDRAYRIGQKRTVYSIKLIAKDTVEEKVLAMQEKKRAVIEATIESDKAMIQSLTWEDVQDLLQD